MFSYPASSRPLSLCYRHLLLRYFFFYSLLMCCCSQNNQHKSLLIQAELRFFCTDSKSQEVIENARILAIPLTTPSDSISCLSLRSLLVDRSPRAAALFWHVICSMSNTDTDTHTHNQASNSLWWRAHVDQLKILEVLLDIYKDTMVMKQTFEDSVLCLIVTVSQCTV